MSDVDGLKAIQTALTDYFVPLAGAGGLTFALLEAYKKLLSIRGRFHKRAVIRWFAENEANIPGRKTLAYFDPLDWIHGSSHYNKPGVTGVKPGSKEQANAQQRTLYRYKQLYQLTTGLPIVAQGIHSSNWLRFRGIDHAIYELETPRMMSQIQEASDAVLNNPNRYPELFEFLTRGCDPFDVNEWAAYMWKPSPHQKQEDAPPVTSDPKAQADRYARMRLLVRRQLDAFQGVTLYRWEDLNQMWAILLGAVILFVAQLVAATDVSASGIIPVAPKGLSDPWNSIMAGYKHFLGKDLLLGVFIKSILGGVLAPIAKDLVTSLSTIKFSK